MRLALSSKINQLVGIVGQQCSGKTHFSDRMAKVCGYQVIHIGEFIRSKIRVDKITSGYVAAPANLDDMVEEFLRSQLSTTEFMSVILDSFPKNLDQAYTFVKAVNHFNVKAKVYCVVAGQGVRRTRFAEQYARENSQMWEYWRNREKAERKGIRRILKYLKQQHIEVITVFNSGGKESWNF